ncbi:MAG: helix-turn-helix domain-containing protein, partial [Gammaproteobacteria bacterium]
PPLRDTWLAYREGLDLDAIATRRGLPLQEAAKQLLQLMQAGQPVAPEQLIAARKYALIAATLERLGEGAAWESVRAALPAFVADHDIDLVRAGW